MLDCYDFEYFGKIYVTVKNTEVVFEYRKSVSIKADVSGDIQEAIQQMQAETNKKITINGIADTTQDDE